MTAIVKTFIYPYIDFKGINITETHIYSLDFSNKVIENLDFKNVWINDVYLTNVNFKNVNFFNCVIEKIKGISSTNSLPSGFISCNISEYQPISTVNRIRRANLSRAQTILVTIIKKIFSTVTKGNGRKEEALLRGLVDKSDSKICDKLLNRMLTENLITKHKGHEGWIYSPVLKSTARMVKILSDLSNSNDELWEYASTLD